MDAIISIISDKFRMLRQKRGVSLDGAAKLTGVSKSMLAQIERGEVSPTVAILWKIANGFKVPFTEFLTREAQSLEIVRRPNLSVLQEDEGRYRNFPLFPFDDRRRFEMYLIELAPGCFMKAEPHPPGSEESITVVQGSLRLDVGGRTEDIGDGDSVRFKADTVHEYSNVTQGLCRLSMVIWYAPD